VKIRKLHELHRIPPKWGNCIHCCLQARLSFFVQAYYAFIWHWLGQMGRKYWKQKNPGHDAWARLPGWQVLLESLHDQNGCPPAVIKTVPKHWQLTRLHANEIHEAQCTLRGGLGWHFAFVPAVLRLLEIVWLHERIPETPKMTGYWSHCPLCQKNKTLWLPLQPWASSKTSPCLNVHNGCRRGHAKPAHAKSWNCCVTPDSCLIFAGGGFGQKWVTSRNAQADSRMDLPSGATCGKTWPLCGVHK
jgi:hypothetical protein